jgi:NAD(P)-dependent dehydrogenase (short-subunit alcohol dehydrogenase family)
MYLEKFRVDGRVAVVTGGGQGIGFACAEALGEAGATVVLVDLDQQRVEAAAEKLRSMGLRAFGERLDVTNPADIAEMARRCRAEHGVVDILVNNAGLAISEKPAETMTDAVWRKHMDVNLDGVFYCCREFGAAMLEAGRGSIVNMGSMSGFVVNKPQEQSAYNASKAAVHHLTKSLAAEWASRGVRVNAVAPTYIATPLTLFGKEKPEMFQTWLDMTPMGRLGEPEEVASTVLFLASDASSLLTGSVILADGGYTCW